jgi:hypothetical protein
MSDYTLGEGSLTQLETTGYKVGAMVRARREVPRTVGGGMGV